MKTVFTNDQCVHVWAQRTQSHGRSNNGNLYFEHGTIYSYGPHFPLAHFINDNIVLINDTSYSISTNRHQAAVRMATRHYTRLYATTDTLRTCLNGRYDKKAAEAVARKQAEAHLLKAAKRRKAHTRRSDINSAISVLQNTLDLTRAYGRKPSPAFKRFADTVQAGVIEGLSDKQKALIEKQKQEAHTKLKEWLSGKIDRIPYSMRELLDIHLRIEGDTVRTTHGAQFPVEHAKKAFATIRAIKQKGEKVELCHHGFPIRLGPFAVDTIHKNGDIRAGCHFVKWPQIEDCARQLGIA